LKTSTFTSFQHSVSTVIVQDFQWWSQQAHVNFAVSSA